MSTDREHDFRITILTCLIIYFFTEWWIGHSFGLSTGQRNAIGVNALYTDVDFIYLTDLCFLTFGLCAGVRMLSYNVSTKLLQQD